MKDYLRATEPPNDYGRVLLLWAAGRLPDVLGVDGEKRDARKQELIELVWSRQRDDGGWSIRTFSEPEKWADARRAKKLRAEPEFKNPPSDGHQTGLCLMALRDAGVPVDDPRIQRAVTWLLANQRESGRWWTRSLNTDRHHFITFSGTCYPLLALAKCGVLPKRVATSAGQ
jgi:squalene-hopene/tetraprenyl-beta-curcumene cyclase